jgi:uncharacterized protein (TIGR03435 family)
MRFLAALPVVAVLLCSQPGYGQQTASRPSFEVASIKPSPVTRGQITPMQTDPGRVVYNNITVKTLIQIAWRAPSWKISGGPAWLDSESYVVAATLPAGSSQDQALPMLQTLLAERFHLVIRPETRQLAISELTVAKGGPKLKPGETGEQWAGGAMKGGIFMGRLEFHQISMADMAELLAGRIGRPVIDRTQLPGIFDISLKWTPDDTPAGDPNANGPSLYAALEEQLGLRLVSEKAPVEVLVVAGVEKPSGN